MNDLTIADLKGPSKQLAEDLVRILRGMAGRRPPGR
jgi:hypothetical protein